MVRKWKYPAEALTFIEERARKVDSHVMVGFAEDYYIWWNNCQKLLSVRSSTRYCTEDNSSLFYANYNYRDAIDMLIYKYVYIHENGAGLLLCHILPACKAIVVDNPVKYAEVNTQMELAVCQWVKLEYGSGELSCELQYEW